MLEERRLKGLRSSYLEANRPEQSVAGQTEQLMVMSDKVRDFVSHTGDDYVPSCVIFLLFPYT